MKIYSLQISHELTRNSYWTKDFELVQISSFVQDDETIETKTVKAKVDVATCPEAYSGRDFFTYADVRDDFGWVDVYRNTAVSKLTPAQYFQTNGISCVAHVLSSVGKESVLILIGENIESFKQVEGVEHLTLQGFRDLLNSYYPKITVKRNGLDFIAYADSTADLYWETTGGSLSNLRTSSGSKTTLSGTDGKGVKIRVGYKYFSNMCEVAL